jgi:hypothetical protein
MAGHHRVDKRRISAHSSPKDNEVRISSNFPTVFIENNSLWSATNSKLPAISMHLHSSYSFTKLPILITFCSVV